jgi:hypothetical protein
MKLKRELINGFIIFIGIAIYFLAIDFAGLADAFFLRMLNLFIVAFGINLTLKQNAAEGISGYFTNLISGVVTSMIGAVFSVLSLLTYIEYRGGTDYLQTLSQGVLFGGGEVKILYYCIGLLFEAVASSVIIAFVLMQFWKNRVEVINQVNA